MLLYHVFDICGHNIDYNDYLLSQFCDIETFEKSK
jgi:hypothetical protein